MANEVSLESLEPVEGFANEKEVEGLGFVELAFRIPQRPSLVWYEDLSTTMAPHTLRDQAGPYRNDHGVKPTTTTTTIIISIDHPETE
jgi:hypothetical protein